MGHAGRCAAADAHLLYFWPGSDRAVSLAQARETFTGEVIAAEENLVVDLAPF
jgi:hypothetical protein